MSLIASPHHVRFPGEDFISKAEYDGYRVANQDLLDARFGYEAGLAAEGTALRRAGTCAACLCPTWFESLGTPEGWRDGQVCQCPERLGQRARGMLHFLQSNTGLDAWSRILLLGSRSPLDARLAVGRPAPVRLARMATCLRGYRLEAADDVFTHAVAWDYLNRVPPLAALLAEVRRVLVPGGSFVFTVPFHYRAAGTLSRLEAVPRCDGRLAAEFGSDVHDVGWDILEMLHAAGFSRARAQHYWSDELGYLGAGNILFSADA